MQLNKAIRKHGFRVSSKWRVKCYWHAQIKNVAKYRNNKFTQYLNEIHGLLFPYSHTLLSFSSKLEYGNVNQKLEYYFNSHISCTKYCSSYFASYLKTADYWYNNPNWFQKGNMACNIYRWSHSHFTIQTYDILDTYHIGYDNCGGA